MPLGMLDQAIFFEAPENINVDGSITTTWVDQSGESPPANDWAHVIAQTGSESFEAARTNASAFIKLQLHYREDVKTTWRVLWEGEEYNITYLDRSERRKGYLWITAEVIGAA